MTDLLILATPLNDLNTYVQIEPKQLNQRHEDHADDRRLT